MKDVVTAILGGGQGSRLAPLTRYRAKPAVPVAGKFRLIDIPISNSLKAGIYRIYVLTQFNSASLHRHIAVTYRFDSFSDGFVNILAAEQSIANRDWYQGTADAVRQNLPRLQHLKPSEILILSGDQLYLMDLREMIEERHRAKGADLTIAVKPVSPDEAPGLGIMRINRDGRITRFVEKPKDPEVIKSLMLDQATIENLGIRAEPGMLLASMGIYVFRAGVLQELLEGTSARDFGKEIIPGAIDDYKVYSFVEPGYWRDIGTIPAFHQANLELTVPVPELNLYNPDFPIYTHPRFLPGSKIYRCEITQSILSDGSIISGSRLSSSIVGIRGLVRSGSIIDQTVVMGATHFAPSNDESSEVPLGIGANCRVRRAIIDLDARVGHDSRLMNEGGVEETDEENYSIRGGIIVVPRGAVIPPGTVI
ncbi:MAG: glucose-1-phosphate adenylyltransferase [bacterium]|nr:glucose-1-phosphate adenylyltransferase [bacterium]